MNEITEKILVILLFIVFTPLTYIYSYFIVELPKKYGYLKFSLILGCYLLIIAIDTWLLFLGLVGLLIFFLVPVTIQLIGAYYFRSELIKDIKEVWQKLRRE